MRPTHTTVALATVFFVVGIVIGMAAHSISGASTSTNKLSLIVKERPPDDTGGRTPFVPVVVPQPVPVEEEAPTVVAPAPGPVSSTVSVAVPFVGVEISVDSFVLVTAVTSSIAISLYTVWALGGFKWLFSRLFGGKP